MSIVVEHTLFKTRDGLSDECRWIAVNNPNYVNFKRQDYVVNAVASNGAFVTLSINTSGAPSTILNKDFTVGGRLYVGAGDINKAVIITAVTFISGAVLIQFQDILIYPNTTGYVNALNRSDYYIALTYLYLKDGVALTKNERAIPLGNGDAKVNISFTLQSVLTLKAIGEDLSVVNIKDENICNTILIIAGEHYYGYNYSSILAVPTFFIVNNQKNAYDRYGSCLAEYEMQLLSANKFLTRMVEPHYWNAFPFALYFIFPESLGSRNPHRNEIVKDINGDTTSTSQTALEIFGQGDNRNKVNSLTLAGGYGSGSVCVSIFQPFSISIIIINSYADEYVAGYTVEASSSPSIGVGISETKCITIGDCTDSPAYMRWRNSLGGFDYWLFGKRQVKRNAVERFETFEPLIFDIEFEQESETVLNKPYNKVWTLGAYLKMLSVKDIQELFTSPFVQWYNESNENWYSVKVKQGTYLETITDDEMAEISFDIEFPNEYTQSQ